jgi:hypothetical protein
VVGAQENAGKMLGKWLKSNYHREIVVFFRGKSVGIPSLVEPRNHGWGHQNVFSTRCRNKPTIHVYFYVAGLLVRPL